MLPVTVSFAQAGVAVCVFYYCRTYYKAVRVGEEDKKEIFIFFGAKILQGTPFGASAGAGSNEDVTKINKA